MSIAFYEHVASGEVWAVVREHPLTLGRGGVTRRPTAAVLARDWRLSHYESDDGMASWSAGWFR